MKRNTVKKLLALFLALLMLAMTVLLPSCSKPQKDPPVDDDPAVDPTPKEDPPLGAAYALIREDLLLDIEYDREDGTDFAGTVTLFAFADAAKRSYTLCFGDENGVLDGYKPLCTCALTTVGEEVDCFKIPDLLAPPAGAMTLVATEADGTIDAYVKIPRERRLPDEKPLYTFAVMSDVHVFDDDPYVASYASINGAEDLSRALRAIETTDASFISITGDLIISAETQFKDRSYDIETVMIEELDKSTGILQTTDLPVYVVKGNHDKRIDDETWESFTGCEPDYSFEKNGDVFIYLSLLHMDNIDSNDNVPYGAEKLAWLEEELHRAAGKRVFLFMHYPFFGMSGLMTGQRYGFSESSTDDDEILRMIGEHGCVTVFNGHTHFNFDSVRKYEKMSVARFESGNSFAVHVPSVAYPRNESNATVTLESEGYVVEVYKDFVLLRGLDFVTGKYAAVANFRLETK